MSDPGMAALDRDDIRAGVAAGTITEAQAAALLALAEARRGARAHMSGRDEPFELFRGFNEIFIVVGLLILWFGWAGLTGLSVALVFASGYREAILYGAIGAGVIAALAAYFTLRRRMVAPSILLTGLFAVSVGQAGLGVAWWLDADTPTALALAAGITTLALLVWYLVFRIPITVALVALGVFATLFGALTAGGTYPSRVEDLFLLSADGPFAVLTFALGIVGFAIAMALDMGDPHRVSLRSRAGFWLHVVAAPAIVNTVALTLFTSDAPGAQAALVAFVAVLALIAVVIDRRSFLVAGVGYIVALAVTVLEGDAPLAILALGLGLVLLGAFWERLRGALMGGLPPFPGKDRLPPWTPVQPETA